jgi:hypothetical protein
MPDWSNNGVLGAVCRRDLEAAPGRKLNDRLRQAGVAMRTLKWVNFSASPLEHGVAARAESLI